MLRSRAIRVSTRPLDRRTLRVVRESSTRRAQRRKILRRLRQRCEIVGRNALEQPRHRAAHSQGERQTQKQADQCNQHSLADDHRSSETADVKDGHRGGSVKELGSTERNTKTVLTPTGLLLEGVSVHPDGLKVISGFRSLIQVTMPNSSL